MLRLFTRRLLSSSSIARNAAPKPAAAAAPLNISSVPEGTPLNLHIKKSGKEPLAKKDEEYPSWLWELLDEKKQVDNLKNDPIKLKRKEMRKSNIKKIRYNNFLTQL
ncbi:mitochondrial 54S ribosomal protein YmL37 [Saccharomycopsis crataegensis]|uniref:Large ribosomal subunit protein mL54 n=1 Tax=Saccharomycopsis crataegensis TaxID=43959 RepID=A0AAV5QG26_9ASCO|nr:mitochondrial 54S ribosomal protein YmL37 [Saccharomycopsis crataegensis]